MTEVKHNAEAKNFEAFQDRRHAGLMTYTWAGEDKFIIDHTEVEEQYNGLGIGKKMVEAVVNFCPRKRSENYSALSVCKGYFSEK